MTHVGQEACFLLASEKVKNKNLADCFMKLSIIVDSRTEDASTFHHGMVAVSI